MSGNLKNVIPGVASMHLPSGLLICNTCHDGSAYSLPAFNLHLKAKHHNIGEIAQDPALEIHINANMQIAELPPVVGLKCSVCNVISKSKTTSSFKQWHIAKSPSCKNANINRINIQIRNGEIFEWKEPSNKHVSFIAQTREKLRHLLTVSNQDDDTFSSNPLQVYFDIFTVFGRHIDYEQLNAYKLVWASEKVVAMTQIFFNFFKEMGSKLANRDVIRAVMGMGGQMMNFQRSQSSLMSLAKMWCQILNISCNSRSLLFNVPNSMRTKACKFYQSPSSANLRDFLNEVVEPQDQVTRVSCSWNDIYIIRVLFLMHFTKRGDFLPPKNLTPAWAQIEYTYKLLLGISIFEAFSNNDHVVSVQYDAAARMVEMFKKKLWFVHLTAVHGQLKSLVNLAPKATVTIVETDDPDVIKISNLDVSFTKHVSTIIRNHYATVVRQWHDVMQNIQVMSIPSGLKDDLACITNGYSFMTDPSNSDLYAAIAANVETHQSFDEVPTSKYLKSFFTQVHDFVINLTILIHLTSGVPPRATETTSILMVNNALLGKRNLFVLGDQIFVSLIYKKTMQKTVNFEPIVRFLPVSVSNLVFSYLTMMRPLYDLMQLHQDQNFQLSPLLYLSNVEKFRKDFKALFTQNYGVSIGIATFRHLVIHFMRCAFQRDSNFKGSNSWEKILSDLAAHSEQTDLENYASTRITKSFAMSDFDFKSYRMVCGVWHSLLGLDALPKQTTVTKQIHDIVMPSLVMPSIKTEIKAALDRDPLEILHSKTPYQFFKSKEQYLAITHTLYSRNDLMLSLPTGGGKSLCYQLPALAFPDRISIIVVPLNAIIRDIEIASQALQIRVVKFAEFDLFQTHPPGALYVVHYSEDNSVIQKLRSFIGAHSSRVHAIFFDEAHLLYEWSELMNTKKFVGLRGTNVSKHKGNQKIKYVMISASLNQHNSHRLKQCMALDEFHSIHLYDDHSNITYDVAIRANKDQALDFVQRVILDENVMGNTQQHHKTLVFFDCLASLQTFKNRLAGCGRNAFIFHGKMENVDKRNTLDMFENTSPSLILCTTALCAGYNHASIDRVVVVGALHSWDNIMQAFGRAGRAGQKCSGVLVLTQSDLGGKILKPLRVDKECFRKIAANNHGVISIPCGALQGCAMCWFCRQSASGARVRPIMQDAMSITKATKRVRVDSDSTHVDIAEDMPQVAASGTLQHSMTTAISQLQKDPHNNSAPNSQKVSDDFDDFMELDDLHSSSGFAVDKATQRRVQQELEEKTTFGRILLLAKELSVNCAFCFMNGKGKLHQRCKVEKGLCVRCLGPHNFVDCNVLDGQRFRKAPASSCFVCFLPINLHTSLGIDEVYGFGHNCKGKGTPMSDNIKYILLSLARNPSHNLTLDILRLGHKQTRPNTFEENYETLKRIYASNYELCLQIIAEAMAIKL